MLLYKYVGNNFFNCHATSYKRPPPQACVVSEDSLLKNVHLRDADKETCLLPRDEEDSGEES
jgi:hypothetical protein